MMEVQIEASGDGVELGCELTHSDSYSLTDRHATFYSSISNHCLHYIYPVLPVLIPI